MFAFLSGSRNVDAMDAALGRRIKRLREERRWTQQRVAAELGVSVKTVSNWESGRNDPRASVGALEHLFGVDLSSDLDVPADPVEAAIRASGLVEWRQLRVIAEYKRHMHEQGESGRSVSSDQELADRFEEQLRQRFPQQPDTEAGTDIA